MNKEEFYEKWADVDGELEEVFRDLDDSWRHGNRVTSVFKIDEKYYEVKYNMSGDGEYNGLREKEFTIIEVEPYEEIVRTIKYKKING